MLDRDELREKYDAWIVRIAAEHGGANNRINESASFAPLPKPLAAATVALVTTAGAHVDGDEPFHTATVAGDASYRVIPDDVDLAAIRFAHTHYDTTSAEKDPNVVLPIDRLHEFVAAGRVGASSPIHIGMMGFNPDPSEIADVTAPEVADLLRSAGVDAVVLAPG